MSTRGDFSGVGVNAQLWFGHGPPIPGTLVPVLAVAVVLIGGALWFGTRWALRGRQPPVASPAPAAQATARRVWAPTGARSSDDAIDRLERLADLHERGALTDAEFETEKARVIGETST